MPQSKQLKLEAKIGDIVSTAYRYSEAQIDAFNSRIYSELHAPHPKEYCRSHDGRTYSFKNANDTELLIMLWEESPNDFTIPIKYVYAGEMEKESFYRLYKGLLAIGLREVESPDVSPPGACDEKNQTYRAVLSLTDSSGKTALRGVIVNPPYPLVLELAKHRLAGAPRYLGLLAALTLGMALPTLVWALARRR